MLKNSIMVDDKEHCIFCFSPYVEEHHIFFGTSDRPIAEKYGLTVPLCNKHHTGSADSPHKNRIIDLALKCWAQTVYEQRIGDRDSFRREFKRSYL
jgi:hypothetical protein